MIIRRRGKPSGVGSQRARPSGVGRLRAGVLEARSLDVVVSATLQSQPDPVFSAPLSSPAQLHCDVDPVSALVHFCSTPSPVLPFLLLQL